MLSFVSEKNRPLLLAKGVVQSSSAHACDGEENSHPVDKLVAHYGSFYRLKKAVAWLLRLKDKFQHKPLRKDLLSVSELGDAEKLVLQHVQCVSYADELTDLRCGSSVARSSSVLKLDPMLNEGLMVVGGRLRHSCLRL